MTSEPQLVKEVWCGGYVPSKAYACALFNPICHSLWRVKKKSVENPLLVPFLLPGEGEECFCVLALLPLKTRNGKKIERKDRPKKEKRRGSNKE